MSIERQHGEITLICDDCGDHLDSNFNAAAGFSKMVAYAKKEGWSIKRDTLDDDEWVHLCPECRS